MINQLKENQIIVAGTNLLGEHLGGLAKQAHENFGLEWGKAEGISGQTYAFPTLDKNFKQVSEKQLKQSIKKLYYWCNMLSKTEFLLTKVGCGIACFSEEYIKSLFINPPKNLVLPEDWK